MFKVGDFIICGDTGNTFYLKMKTKFSSSSYLMIDIHSGKEEHLECTNTDTHHPILGIHPSDNIKINGHYLSYAVVTGSNIVFLEVSSGFYHYFSYDEILKDATNLSNSHWNTCAQHYKHNILAQANTPSSSTIGPKFKPGDRIESIYGVTGIIKDVKISSFEYEIQFDSQLVSVFRSIKQIDQDYKLELLPIGTTMSTPSQGIIWGNIKPYDIITSNNQNNDGCNHEFVSYTGLQETFDFCKKCDLKKT